MGCMVLAAAGTVCSPHRSRSPVPGRGDGDRFWGDGLCWAPIADMGHDCHHIGLPHRRPAALRPLPVSAHQAALPVAMGPAIAPGHGASFDSGRQRHHLGRAAADPLDTRRQGRIDGLRRNDAPTLAPSDSTSGSRRCDLERMVDRLRLHYGNNYRPTPVGEHPDRHWYRYASGVGHCFAGHEAASCSQPDFSESIES